MKQALFIIILVCGLGLAGSAFYVYRLAPGRGGGDEPESVSTLAARLKSADVRARRDAAAALRDLGPEAAAAVPALTDALRDDDADTRHGAALALTTIQAGGAAAAVPVLIDGLKARRAETRVDCAWALMASTPADALAPLLDALKDPNVDVRRGAGYVLAAYNQPDETARIVPVLAALLTTADEARTDWVWALAQLGPAARAAEAALTAGLKDDEATFRRAAAFALVEVLGEKAVAAVPVLVEGLKDPEAKVRSDVVHVLGKLKGTAKPAAAALQALLKDEDDNVRTAAAEALKGLAQP